MKLFQTVGSALRPPKQKGRALVTFWDPSEKVDSLLAWSEKLNLDPVVLCDGHDDARLFARQGLTGISGSFLSDVEGTHHQFSLVCVPGNIIPIPDDGSDPDWRHVLQAGPYTHPGGVLVFVVRRQRLVVNRRWIATLLQGYKDVRVAEYDAEHLVLVAIRRGGRSKMDVSALASLLSSIEDQNLVGLPEHAYPLKGSLKDAWFRSKFFDPIGMEAYAQKLPWGKSVLTDIIGWDAPDVSPVLPLRATHLAAVIAAGAMGTIRVTSPTSGHEVIMRGRTLRREREQWISDGEDDDDVFQPAEHVKTGDFITEITMLDLEDCTLTRVNPSRAHEIKEFLAEWGEVLAIRAQEMYPVAYDPSTTHYRDILHSYLAEILDEPLNLVGQGDVPNLSEDSVPSLRFSQRHVLAGVLLKLLGKGALSPNVNRDDFAHLKAEINFLFSGQTAVGKTLMGLRLLLALVIHYGRKRNMRIGDIGWPLTAFVTTPANLKPAADAVKLAAPFLQARIVERYTDLKKVLDEAEVSPVPLVMVVSRTMLRMMQRIEPAVVWGNPPYESTTPNIYCPSAICRKKIEIADDEIKNWTPDRLTKGAIKIRGMRCSCGAALWQETHGPYSLALAMKREFKKRGLKLLATVIDEVHEDRGVTNQGQSMAWLTYISRHTVGMTGTLYGGTPSTIFPLLYRLLPTFRKVWGYWDEEKFSSRYGNWRQRRGEDGSWSYRTYLPGISPELIATLLDYTVFFTMADAGFEMPPRVDMPAEVHMSTAEQRGMEMLVNEVQAKLQTKGSASDKRISASPKTMQKLYAAPSGFHLPYMAGFSPGWRCPKCGKSKVDKEDPCLHPWLILDHLDDKDKAEIVDGAVEPQLDPEWLSSKELELVKFVRTEAAKGRPCLIYLYHTGKFQLLDRLKTVLEISGLKPLNTAGVATRSLEKTINMSAFEGIHAVLINPKRCGTGTNLIGMPTIIWYQPVWSAYDTLQATERSCRPTQTQEVRIAHMATAGTAEVVVLARAIEKMVSILMTGGIDHSSMAAVMDAVGHEQSFHELLIESVSQHIEVDLSSVFATLQDANEYDKTPVGGRVIDHHREERTALPEVDLGAAVQISMF